LDGSFGSGGKVTTHITTDDTAKAMDIQSDGRIVVGGQTFTGSTYDFAVARYLARPPVVSIGDAFVVEENAESVFMQFPVSLAGAGASDHVTVDYATVADSAGSKDFGATTGTVTFNPGQTTGTISVSVKGDLIYEGDETFFVKLSSPVGATLGDSLGEGTIVDNDAVPDLSISSPSVTEGNSGTTQLVYTLGLTNPSSDYISVDFTTADGTATAPADYQAISGTRWFKPGQVTRTITVYVKGETVQELNETVLVNLSDANGAGIETGQGVGTIIDDDRPTISINDAQVTEGASGTTKTMTFTVTLSKAGTSSITVQYATANDTAVAPGDYTAKSGTLTFSAGQVSKPITVTIKGDNLAECTESFFVTLSNPTNASIADGRGVGTIVTDEPNPCD
jgi:chitinase